MAEKVEYKLGNKIYVGSYVLDDDGYMVSVEYNGKKKPAVVGNLPLKNITSMLLRELVQAEILKDGK